MKKCAVPCVVVCLLASLLCAQTVFAESLQERVDRALHFALSERGDHDASGESLPEKTAANLKADQPGAAEHENGRESRHAEGDPIKVTV